MKMIVRCVLVVAFCGVAAFAGYGSDDVSVGVLDPLYATGLCLHAWFVAHRRTLQTKRK